MIEWLLRRWWPPKAIGETKSSGTHAHDVPLGSMVTTVSTVPSNWYVTAVEVETQTVVCKVEQLHGPLLAYLKWRWKLQNTLWRFIRRLGPRPWGPPPKPRTGPPTATEREAARRQSR